MDIDKALLTIKTILEKSIIDGGTVGKRNLIRSSAPINQLHELVKSDLIKIGFKRELIKPNLGNSSGEVAIYGFLKKKNQDIVVLPEGIYPKEEKLKELNVTDPLGEEYSKRLLSINVRSQLSSVAKNFDTIFERTFAESFNLHLRLNSIVLGEMFLLTIREFDDSYSDQNIVRYRELGGRVENQLEKYIKFFSLINNRRDSSQDFHKYERVCLLIVDFSSTTPKLYQSKEELIKDGIVSKNFNCDLESLNYNNFYNQLTSVYNSRFKS